MLSPGTCDCGLIWKYDLDYVIKLRVLRWLRWNHSGLSMGPKTNGLFHKLKETETKMIHLKTGKSRQVDSYQNLGERPRTDYS